MSNRLNFTVRGSEDDEYNVTFGRDADLFSATCTCVSGKMKRGFCKHRLDLMHGDISSLVSDNWDDLEKIPDLLAGTTAEQPFKALNATYGELRTANAALDAAKKGVKNIEDEINKIKDKLLQATSPTKSKH